MAEPKPLEREVHRKDGARPRVPEDDGRRRALPPHVEDEALARSIAIDLQRLDAEIAALPKGAQTPERAAKVARLEERRLELLRAGHEVRRRLQPDQAGEGCSLLTVALGFVAPRSTYEGLRDDSRDCVRVGAGGRAAGGVGAAAVAETAGVVGGRVPNYDRSVRAGIGFGGMAVLPERDGPAFHRRDPGQRGGGGMPASEYLTEVQPTEGTRSLQLFPQVARDLELFQHALKSQVAEVEVTVLGLPLKLQLQATGEAKALARGFLGAGVAHIKDYDGTRARAELNVPARADLVLTAKGGLDAVASLVGLSAAKLRGELSFQGVGTVDLGWSGEAMVGLGPGGAVETEVLSHRVDGGVSLSIQLSAHAIIEALGREVWRADWDMMQAGFETDGAVDLGWRTVGRGLGTKAMLESQGESLDLPTTVAKAMSKAKRKEEKQPPNLLEYLKGVDSEVAKGTREAGLEAALEGAPAPAPKTTFDDALQHVYKARPSLDELFYEGTAVGQSLNADLVTVSHIAGHGDGAVERRFEPKQGGGYYRLIREKVKSSPLDESVRRPTVKGEVLTTPTPKLPAPAKTAIQKWLATTPLPDRSLPTNVREQVRRALLNLSLVSESRGDEVNVTLAPEVSARVKAIFAAAKGNDPERSAVYAWWVEHFEKPERHHVWPKWLLGHEAQVYMVLPRCIHNMTGVGLDDGGFHQVLNRLFEQDPAFGSLKAEDSRTFRRFYEGLGTDADRTLMKQRIRRLLVRTYATVISDAKVLVSTGRRLADEMARIPTEVSQ